MEDCDVARCLVTGQQRLSCDHYGVTLFDRRDPGHDCGLDTWSGEWPGARECREYGFWARWRQRPDSLYSGFWEPCHPDAAGAVEDLNRLYREGHWNLQTQRWDRWP